MIKNIQLHIIVFFGALFLFTGNTEAIIIAQAGPNVERVPFYLPNTFFGPTVRYEDRSEGRLTDVGKIGEYIIEIDVSGFMLGGKVSVTGGSITNFATAAFQTTDVVFSCDSTPNGPVNAICLADPPQFAEASIFLDVGGSFSGGGNGSVRVGAQLGSYVNQFFGLYGSNEGPEFSERLKSPPTIVPLDQPIIFRTDFEIRAAARPSVDQTVDFSNSIDFNPARVFDLPEGITVNSESWGLVNNQLQFYFNNSPTVVPEPTTGMLLMVGLLGLAGRGRKKLFKK